MSWKHWLTGALLVSVGACGDDGAPADDNLGDAGTDDGGELEWWEGGEDIPEYSLARLLIADGDAPQITVFDLDSETIAGTMPIAASTVFTGAPARYSYTHDDMDALLHVVDSGQWLLSHIDHFHIAKSTLEVRGESLQVAQLSSITSNEGWIAVVDGTGGTVSSFQERSITAMSFMPSVVSVEPHAGVALVSRAHVVASDLGADDTWAIAVWDAVLPDAPKKYVGSCTTPRSIAGGGDRVLIACEEGILSLTWINEADLSATLLSPTVGDERPTRVRVNEKTGHALFDRGPLKLAFAQGDAISELAFDAPVLHFDIRRQGTAAVVLTSNGKLHEVELPALTIKRSLDVISPYEGDAARAPRFALSHAYAYVADARSPEVQAIRLSSWQLEDRFVIGGAPLAIAMAGMPSNYTDDKE